MDSSHKENRMKGFYFSVADVQSTAAPSSQLQQITPIRPEKSNKLGQGMDFNVATYES